MIWLIIIIAIVAPLTWLWYSLYIEAKEYNEEHDYDHGAPENNPAKRD